MKNFTGIALIGGLLFAMAPGGASVKKYIPASLIPHHRYVEALSNDPLGKHSSVPLSVGLLPPVISVSSDSLSAVLSIGDSAVQTLTIDNSSGDSELTWSIVSPSFSFSKADYADWTLPENQDCITSGVCLTRQNNRGLFNVAQEDSYTRELSPVGTLWATGPTANPQSDYMAWEDAVNYCPPCAVDDALSLYLEEEGIYYDIIFTDWTEGGEGGGFSYERSKPTPKWLTLSATSGTIAAGVSLDITVNFNAKNLLGGDYDFTLLIESDDPINPAIGIPVLLEVDGIPDITLSTDTLDFGRHFVGVAVDQTITISNPGTDRLEVGSLPIGNADYSLSDTIFEVPPGKDFQLTVTYSPSAVAADNALLTLISNDPDEDSLTVALKGSGAAPPVADVSADSLTEVLSVGATSVQTLTIDNSAGGSDLTWRIVSPSVLFSKADYADWTLPENQDCLTESVCLTRQNNRGLFNIAQESSYSNDLSPAGTLWAAGSTASPETDYTDWETAVDNCPTCVVGDTLSLYLLMEDVYYDIVFTSWTSGGEGGGFSYERWESIPDWVTVSNTSGTVSAGASQDITVGFDATQLLGGTYEATLVMETNDPANSRIAIPLSLTVNAAPGNAYTIGGVDPHFANFTDAVEALTRSGITDSTTFNVRPGTYNEQLRITDFQGNACNTPVIFQSETGDSTSVILTYGSTDRDNNYTVQLDGASGITFRNMTLAATGNSYGQVIDLRNDASCNTFSGNIIRGVTTTGNSSDLVLIGTRSGNDNGFKGNRLTNGSYGIDSFRGDYMVIADNTLQNQSYTGIYQEDLISPVIQNNIITTTSTRTDFYGIYSYVNEDSVRILNNRIDILNGGYGIYHEDPYGDADAYGITANNFISIGGTSDAYGIRAYDADYHRIYHNNVHIYSINTTISASAFYNRSGSNMEVYNNVFTNSGGGYSFYTNTTDFDADYNDLYTTGVNLAYYSGDLTDLAAWQAATGGDVNSVSADPLFYSATNLHVQQVALDAAGTPVAGVALDIDGEPRDAANPDIGADEFTPPATDAGIFALLSPQVPFNAGVSEVIVLLQNNGLDTLTAVSIPWELNGVAQDTIDWTGSLPNGNGVEVSLGGSTFDANTAYHIKVWSHAPNGVADGNAANDTLTVFGLHAAMEGVYTIGGVRPDFADFTEAVAALGERGIAGSITFNVRSGTYNEQVRISAFPGSACNTPVIFRSETGDSTDVTLTYGSNNRDNNYTVQLDGVSGITFRHMTLASTGSSYGRVVDLRNGASCNTFLGNVIRGVSTTSDDRDIALIYSPSSTDPDNDNQFVGNFLINASYGFYYLSNSSNRETGLYISGNVLQDQAYISIYLESQKHPSIEENTIVTTAARTDFYGIYLYQIDDSLKVIGNKIHIANGGYGLYNYFSNGSADARGLIANNFISIGGISTTYGIYAYLDTYQRYYHNTVHIYSTTVSTSASAFYNRNGSDKEVYNNILVYSGGGYAFYTNTGGFTSDHNDLYTTGANLAYYSGNRSNLTAWQTATGGDANSLSVDPGFASDTDLHVTEIALNGAGSPVAEVSDDIDGEPRDIANPDVGADEFTPPATDAGIFALLSPQTPFPGASEVIVRLKNYGLDTLTDVTIRWEINGMVQDTVDWSGSLLTGAVTDVNLGTSTFDADIAYRIKAWSYAPNGGADGNSTNDTLTVSGLYVAMEETYTIGGDSPNFANFTEAVAALNERGILDSVTFNVRPGTYNEQIQITDFPGNGCNTPVTFRSETGDSTSVTLTYGSNDRDNNYTVQLDGVSGITFRHMTLASTGSSYGRVVDLRNGASCNTFSGNAINGTATTTTSDYMALIYSPNNTDPDNDNRFVGNTLVNGSYGLLYGGYPETGLLIAGNTFRDQQYMGIYLDEQNSPIIEKNTITTISSGTDFYGVYLHYNDDSLKVVNNLINIPNGGYGVYQRYNYGNANAWGLVANNFISIGGSSTAYGIYPYYGTYQRYYHNTVHIYSTTVSTSASAFYNRNGSDKEVYNNILVHGGGGYAFYTNTSSFTSDHNDLYTTGTSLAYYSGNRSNLAAWQAVTGGDANSLSVDPGFVSDADLHVTELSLNKAGRPVPGIATDIDGEARNTRSPDIGADEFGVLGLDVAAVDLIPVREGLSAVRLILQNVGELPVDSLWVEWSVNAAPQSDYFWVGSLVAGQTDTLTVGSYDFAVGTAYEISATLKSPNGASDADPSDNTLTVSDRYALLGGTYTIGGVSPDFATFDQAVTTLTRGGVISPVLFHVRAGTYNEQISIPEILGSTAPNTIIFQAEDGDSTSVTLAYSASFSNNYTVELAGAYGVTFRNLTLTTLNNSYGRVISIKNNSQNNLFENNIVQGRDIASTSVNTAVIYSGGNQDNGNAFVNNHILYGSYGFYYYGRGSGSGQREAGTVIRDNLIADTYYAGIFAGYQEGLQLVGNDIRSNSDWYNYRGIYVENGYEGTRVLNNVIHSDNGGFGIIMDDCGGSVSNPSLVANNFIYLGGTTGNEVQGFWITYSDHINLYHNTIHITNTETSSRAFYQYSGSQMKLLNNIFANTGGGYGCYVGTTGAVTAMDFNNYYILGDNFGYWNGDIPDLTTWRSASGYDDNSYHVNPRFVAETDLHVREVTLNAVGTAVAEVTEDIDGEPRDMATPDIGADEFTPDSIDAGVDALTNPIVPFAQGTQSVKVVLKNHGLDTLTSVRLQWSLNDVLQPVVEWNGILPSGDTIQVTLGDYVFDPDTAYAFKSWTEAPNNATDADHTNDTTEVTGLYSALIGIYTIGGITPDFATFGDAVAALANGGIIGTVTFKARAGSYNEQISIPPIQGASATDSIIFETASGNNDVSLIFSANPERNYTVLLDGASYITLRNLAIGAGNTSYGTALKIRNGAHHNTFESNIFNGRNTSSASTDLAVVFNSSGSNENHLVFVGNKFVGGSYGYYGYGENTGSLETGTVFENNTFENQYYVGIRLYYQDAPKIRSNDIITTTTYTNFRGVETYYGDNDMEISGNNIQIPNGGYGLYLYENDAYSAAEGMVKNNFVYVGGTTIATGIYTYYCDYQNIYHNNIHITSTLIGSNSRVAYFFRGSNLAVRNNIFSNSGGSYTIYQDGVSTFVSDHNDLYTTGDYLGYWSGNRADLSAWSSYTGQDQNSISIDPFFYSDTDLHVYNVALNASALKIDSVTEDFDGQPRALTPDIGADEFVPPTEDAGILSLYEPITPVTEGINAITVELFNNAAANLNSVTIHWAVNDSLQSPFEWEGVLTPTSSDSVTIGTFDFQSGLAYEITAWTSQPNGLADQLPSNDSITVSGLYVGMNGTYTIGGIAPDFVNFTRAVAALRERNVNGSVTFLVADGIYSEKITMEEVSGASADNTITFISASGDSTGVTLTSVAISSQNYTLRLWGADHIIFKNMTLAATGTFYGRVVELRAGANNNTFENCIIQSVIYNSTYLLNNRVGVYSNGEKDNYNTFRNNIFRDGAYGIYFHGAGSGSGSLEEGTVIEGNRFEDQYYRGIQLYYQFAPKVTGNDMVTFTTYTNYYALYGVYADRMEISSNKISSNNGGYGIRLENSDGIASQRGQIYNNFIHLGGTSTAYGLYLANADDQDVSFNNVNITSTNASSGGTAFYNTSGTNLRVRNNALVNAGGGYAYYNNTASAISESDYNDLYTTGANLAYWGSNHTSLEAFQSATGKDANSISIDPGYTGVTDLHVSRSSLDGAGTPVAGITTDIDGQLRNETTPDIGADEFGAGLTTNDIGVVALVGPADDCLLDTAETVIVRIQNFGIDTITNFLVTYVLNDTITVTDSIEHVALLGGRNLEYGFTTPTDLSAAGFYNFLFYTTLPGGDSNVNNDTLYSSVITHYPSVTAEVSANDTICQGSYAALTAEGGSSYKWRILGSDYIRRYGSFYSVSPYDTTTYTVEVANEFGCSDTDTVTVFVLPAPEQPSIEVVGSTSVCTQDTVRLVSSITENIVWNTGTARSEIEVFDPGTYRVTHIDSLTGCTSSESVTLSYTPPPYITPGSASICEGGSVTLTVQYGSRYLWSTGETTRSITVSPSGNTIYTVDVTNAAGCEYPGLRKQVSVSPVLPTPEITSITPDTEVCQGSNITLRVEGDAQTYRWSNGRSGAAINVSPTADTRYRVTATNGSCSIGSDTASVFVSVLPLPVAPIIVATGSSTLSFCDADSIILTSSDFADSLFWSTGDTTQSITVFEPGVYSVSLVNALKCVNTSSVTITDPPDPYIIGKSVLCEGESATLSVNNGAIYNWSTGEDTRLITVMPDATTTYYVDIRNEEGCQYEDSIQVTILPLPKITSITPDMAVCSGDEITLNVSGSARRFIWSEGGSGTSITVSPTETTTFGVTATNGCGDDDFNDFKEVTVTVLPLPDLPVITTSGSPVICEGDSITLTSDIAGTIVWSTGESTASVTVAEPGTYTVINTNALGCTISGQVEIANPDRPEIVTSGFSSTICRGDSITLTYTNATAYNWSVGSTDESVTVSPENTSAFHVTATNTFGCVYNDSITITIIDPVPPGSVGNMIPSDGEADISLPVALSWTPAANATHYDLYVWLDSLPRPDVPFASNIDQIGRLIREGLNYQSEYSWQVMAKNTCHTTAGSVQSFRLRDLPDLRADNVQSPVSAFSGQSISVSWEVFNNGNGATLSQTWTDAIYLSTDTTLTLGRGLFVDDYLGGVSNFASLLPSEGYSNIATVTLPRGISGNHYLFVKTDAFENLPETDNDNNAARIIDTLQIRLAPYADLQVKSIIPPNNAFSGQEVNIVYTVENLGTGGTDVTTWQDRVYITDSENATGGQLLRSRSHTGGLNRGSTYTDTVSVKLPEGIFGDYFIYVTTDFGDRVFEFAFENNNNGISDTVNVILTPPIDLYVTNVQIPTSASNNQDITIRWEVINQGGSAIGPGTWRDRVFLSPSPDFEAAIFLGELTQSKRGTYTEYPPDVDLTGDMMLGDAITVEDYLKPGDTYFAQKNVKVPKDISGPYYVFVETDGRNDIFEYVNESNNKTNSATPLEVLHADLAVGQVVVPDSLRSGESIQVMWVTNNLGSGDVLNRSWITQVGLLPTDTIYNPDSVIVLGALPHSGTLSSGDSLDNGLLVTIPQGITGDYDLVVHIDRKEVIYEGFRKFNNVIRRKIHLELPPFPDLEITEPQTADTAVAWDWIPFRFSVSNTGDTAVRNISWKDRIYLSPDSVWNPESVRLILELPRSGEVLPGQSYTIADSVQLPMLPSDVPTNICYLYFYADGDSSIYEYTEETNNIRRSNPIFVYSYPPPDFTVTQIGIDDSVSSGERTCVMWRTENIGNALLDAEYAPWWYDGVYLSNDTIWDRSDTFLWDWVFYRSDLDSGAYDGGVQFYDFPNGIEGDYYILMIADHTSRIPEADTTNNYLWRPIHVDLTPSPDLVVTEWKSPALGIARQPIDIFWTLENTGEGPTLQGSRSGKVYLSTDLIIDDEDIVLAGYSRDGDLMPGEVVRDSLEVTLPLVTSGNYILILQVDDNDRIYEHPGEDNNVQTAFIEVVKPEPSDLVVTQVSGPVRADAGKEITVNWVIKNEGENPATGRMWEAVFLSRDTVPDPGDALLASRSVDIYLPPLAERTMELRAPLTNVEIGDYYLIVDTDIRDNIPEQNDENNVRLSSSPLTVDVAQLFPETVVIDTVIDGTRTPLYYRFEAPDSLAGETLVVSLTGDPAVGANEMYVSYESVPTRSTHDYAFSTLLQADQEVYVPSLRRGTYYVYVHAGYNFDTRDTPDIRQITTLEARILPFAVRHVTADEGGNTGSVTVKIEGSKFTRRMLPQLIRSGVDTLEAYYLEYLDATSVFASFNLLDAPVGLYDLMMVTAGGDTTVAENAFTVVPGTEGSLGSSGVILSGNDGDGILGNPEFACNFSGSDRVVDRLLEITLDYPASTRPQRTFPIRIHYANGGNVDLPTPTRFIISLEDAPIAYSVVELAEGYKELDMEFKELGGPSHVLRPGAGGTITIYTKALGRRLRYRILK